MSEISNQPGQTLSRYYRDIRSSPARSGIAAVGLVAIATLVVLGIRFVAMQNRSLALLNWLNLFLIPLVLIVAAVWLTQAWRRTQFEIARQRDERAMIEAYYDRLTSLLLERNLRQADSDDEVARAARAHTLTLLRELDGRARGQVLRFLYESALLNADHPAVDLQSAQLSAIDLARVQMAGVNLRNVDLREAQLIEAIMPASDLRQAHLQGADLT